MWQCIDHANVSLHKLLCAGECRLQPPDNHTFRPRPPHLPRLGIHFCRPNTEPDIMFLTRVMINEKLSQSTMWMNMKITVFSLSVSLSAFLCAHFPQFYIPAREPRLRGEGRRRINHRVPNQVYISTHSNQIIPKICKAP